MSESTYGLPPPRARSRLQRAVMWGLLALVVLALLAAGFGWLAWKSLLSMPGTSHRGPLPPPDEALEQLTAELRADVEALAGRIGQRHPLSEPNGFARAADWVERRLASIGYAVESQQYRLAGFPAWNFQAEVPGTRSDEIVIVGAHYDSAANTPGANDNASGVAALVALAQRFSGRHVDRTVRFVAFAAEEMPFFQTEKMGSWVYARKCRRQGDRVVAMINLETIGYYTDVPRSQRYPLLVGPLYPSTGNFVAIVGDPASAALVRRVVATFRRSEPFPCEGAALPRLVPEVGFSDHWAFWQEGYPAVMVTDTAMFRYPYYHQPEDTPEKVDYERLARVVRGLEQVVLDLATCQ